MLSAALITPDVAQALAGPQPLPIETISPGTDSHEHGFKEVAWDSARFGPSVTDFEGAHATFKTLERCACGAERITSVRALY